MLDKLKLQDIKSKIFLKTNKTPILLLFRILFAILFVDIILIISFLLVDYISIKDSGFLSGFSYEQNIVILALLIHIFFFLYLFIYWYVDFYTIGDGKVTHSTGILFKKKNIFIVNEINSLEIYQTFLGRIFDYGNVIIFYNEKEFILRSIPHPKEFVEFIEILKIEE